MAYTRKQWEDSPSTNTPIYAEDLNNMEEGIYDAHQDLLKKVPMLKVLGSGGDLNSDTYTQQGMYQFQGNVGFSNLPPDLGNTATGALFTFNGTKDTGTCFIVQIFFAPNKTYHRRYTYNTNAGSGSWDDWKDFAFAEDIPTIPFIPTKTSDLTNDNEYINLDNIVFRGSFNVNNPMFCRMQKEGNNLVVYPATAFSDTPSDTTTYTSNTIDEKIQDAIENDTYTKENFANEIKVRKMLTKLPEDIFDKPLIIEKEQGEQKKVISYTLEGSSNYYVRFENDVKYRCFTFDVNANINVCFGDKTNYSANDIIILAYTVSNSISTVYRKNDNVFNSMEIGTSNSFSSDFQITKVGADEFNIKGKNTGTRNLCILLLEENINNDTAYIVDNNKKLSFIERIEALENAQAAIDSIINGNA